MLLVFGSICGSTEGNNLSFTNEKTTIAENKTTNIKNGILNITTRDKQARHSLFFAKYMTSKTGLLVADRYKPMDYKPTASSPNHSA